MSEKEDKLKAKLRKIIIRESEQCMGRDGSKLSQERASLKEKYLGKGYAVDGERSERGFSTYVDRTVLETVEWAKPGLMRVFCGDEIIRFDPRTPEEEKAAQDATTYVNQVVFGRNMFKIVHDVLTDGLYQRVGWCLAHCPEKTERKTYQFTGLTEEEAQAVLSSDGIDLDTVEIVRYPAPFKMTPPPPPQQPAPMPMQPQHPGQPPMPPNGKRPPVPPQQAPVQPQQPVQGVQK